MRDGKLQKLLKSKGLIETSALFSTEPPLPSYISGSAQIDAIWTTPNLKPKSLSILPHYFGIRDHRVIIVDFPMAYFMGDRFISIVRSKMRRLTTLQPKAV